MTTEHSRRNFLRGRLSEPKPPRMRPPGAQAGFASLCTHCGDCARACPEAIIVRHPSGEPVVDFSYGACTFCNACTEACEAGALKPAAPEDWPWRATIVTNCFALNGVFCRSCEDACEPRAIRFRLMTGGRSAPVLDQNQCTGCGECASTCPAGAIAFEMPRLAAEEKRA